MEFKRNYASSTAILAAMVALLNSAAAYADDPTGEPNTEIVVTAQKKSESLSNVGMSVSAIGGERLESLGVSRPTDLGALTPGLVTVNAIASGTPLFAIRGMGLDNYYQSNNSSVAVYINGVYQSTPIFLEGAIFDVDRVEVLKGPQGTLYGQNAGGGVVNIITKRPSAEADGYLNLGYGNWNAVNASGAIGGPLSDRVRGRVAFNYQANNDWQRDIDTGRGFGRSRQFGIRGELAYEVSDRLTATIGSYYSHVRATPTSSQVYGDEVAADAFGGIIPGILDLGGFPIAGRIDSTTNDPSKVRVGDLDVRKEEDGYGARLNLVYTGDGFSIDSTTAWDYHKHFARENTDGSPFPSFQFDPEFSTGKQFYQEVRAQFKTGSRIDWVAGVSFASDSQEGITQEDFSTVCGCQTTPLQKGAFIATADFNQKNRSFGVYATATTRITDQLNLITGARYSIDRRGFVGEGTNLFAGTKFTVVSEDGARTDKRGTYRVGLEWRPISNTLLYGNVSTGVKNGVFQASPPTTAASWSYVPPEKVFGYELGIRTKLFSNTLSMHAAYYHYDVKDRQGFFVFFAPPSIGSGLASIPKSKIDGGELEVEWRPTSRLFLSGSLSLLNARVTDPPANVRGFTLYTPVPAGTSLSLSPKRSYALLASYTLPLAAGYELRAQADYNYRSGMSGTLSDPFAIVGSRANLGGRLTLLPESGRWTASIWSKNLTNRWDEARSLTDFFGGRVVIRQQPRTYGFDLTFKLF